MRIFKSRAASFIAAALAVASAATFFAFGAVPANANGTPTVIHQSDLSATGASGWFFYNDETDVIDNTLGSFVAGPGTPPLGTGSVQVSVSGTQRRNLATFQFAGTPLSSLTALGFDTYNPSAGNGASASANRSGYLELGIDFTGTSTAFQHRINYVPAENTASITQNTWKHWDAINSGNALWNFSGTVWPGTAIPGTTDETWNWIITNYPAARVHTTIPFVGIRVGSPYSDGYTENIDNFVFATSTTSTFDFDVPDTTAPVISAQSNVVFPANALGGATNPFVTPTATDNIDGTTTVACAPAASSLFPIGLTTVNCSTQDAAMNVATSTFTVRVTAGPVSATTSSAVAITPVTTDGGLSTITITAEDQYGNPIRLIPRANVVIAVSPLSAGDVLKQPLFPTNASGQTTGSLQSTVAGDKIVTVTINGVPLAPITIHFLAGQATTGAIVSAEGTTTAATLAPGTTVHLSITIKDGHGNVVPDNTPVSISSDLGTIGGSGNTVGGVAARTLTVIGKGVAHLSLSGVAASGDTTITFKDATPPVITLNGSSPVTAEYLGSYADLGATATDDIDGTITPSIVVTNPVLTNVLQFNPALSGKIVATYTVTYNVSDSSGNAATPVTRTVNIIDTTAPVISSITSDAASAGVIKIGDMIHFTATPAMTELGASVAGSYNGHALAWTTSNSGATYTATYAVTAGDADQSAPLQISGVTMTDEAGNVSAAAAGTDIAKTIDATVPTLSSVHIQSNNAHTNLAKAGDAVTVSFTGSEALQTPVVTIDGQAASVTGSGSSYSAAYTMTSSEPTGAVSFSIAFADTAGNAGVPVAAVTDSSSVTFDKTAPLAPAVTISNPINIANQITAAITVNGEANAQVAYALTDASSTTITGTGMTDGSGAFTATVNASSLADGTVTASATLTDLAGNTGAAGTATAAKDTTIPVVTASVSPSTGTVGVGAVVTATLTSSQTDLVADSCSVNGVSVLGSFVNHADGTYSFTYTVAAGNAEQTAGNLPISCVVHEASGNSATVSSFAANTLAIDVTPPTVPAAVSPADGSFSTTANLLKVDWTDATDTAGTLPISYYYQVSNSSATNGATGDFTSVVYASGALSASEIPTPGTGEGTYFWHVRAVDAAGNSSAWSTTSSFIVDDTAPVVTAPADQVIEAAGAMTSVSTTTTPALVLATAHDVLDPNPIVTFAPNPLSLGLGTTTVTWTATDAAGNTSSVTSNIIIKDTTAPTIATTSDITAEATGSTGATVTYVTPIATDLVDPSVTASCLPASGSVFGIATTTVTCTASDLSGNVATSTFSVIIRDTTAPTVTIAPPTQTVEATSINGAAATYAASATDLVDGNLTSSLSCSAASGSVFPIGTTTPGVTNVTCSVTDAHGNSGSATSTVTVVDTTAPVITAPADQTFPANAASSTPALMLATATDAVTASPAIAYSPTSFPIGTTQVTWTATDAHGNVATTTSNVTIVPAAIAKVTVTPVPTTTTTAGSITLTINGRDQFDNITTNQSGTQVIVSADNGGALSQTIVTLVNGVATATLTKSAPGTVNVTVSSGSLIANAAVVTFTSADTTGPSVTGFSPAISATPVSISAPIYVDFTEALNLSTVTSANIVLTNASTSAAVPATLSITSLSGGAERVNIVPASALDYSTNYFVTVSGVTDLAGNVLVDADGLVNANAGFVTAANTADVTAPTILSANPANAATGVSTAATPSITFSEPINATTATPSSVTLLDTTTSASVSASVAVDNGGTRIVITPAAALAYGDSYSFSVTTDIADQAGNNLAAPASFGFTVAAAPADTNAPVISNIQVSSIGTSTATVTWTTDEASNSQVEYGQTSAYGNMTLADSTLTTTHSVIVSGLAGSTSYHFRVRSTDAATNAGVSGDNTFATNLDDSTAVLSTTGIDATQTFATADGTFADGFHWIFHVTVPTNETSFKMKFADFVSGANSIPAANNIRFYSPQSSNASASSSAILITAANAYSTPMTLSADTNPALAGRQIDVYVETAVPVGTPGGSYGTTYGIQSL